MDASLTKIRDRIPILGNPNQFPYETVVLNDCPPIIRIKGLLSPEECEYIIDLAKPKLNNSTLIVDNKEVVNDSRSSRSAFITPNGSHPQHDIIIHSFLQRLSKICGYPVNHFEGMKVVNYKKGQKYLGHYDYFREHDNFTKKTGDRILTFFVYLNTLDEQDGGATSFPKLGIKSQPVAGEAAFWVNIDFDGNYFEETLHGGDQVVGDVEKWGINVWVREKGYSK